MKKSICIFINNYSKRTETFILNHLIYLVDKKIYDITVLCHNWENKFNISDQIEVVRVNQSVKSRILAGLKVTFLKPQIFFKLLQPKYINMKGTTFPLVMLLENRSFDIIHCHFGHNGRLLAPLIQNNVVKKNTFITQFHGLDLTSEKCKNPDYYKHLKECLDIALGNTNYSKKKLEQLYFPVDKIKAIPVGSDVNFFKAKNSKSTDDPFKIIFVGRLIELKGAKLLPELDKLLQDKIGSNFSIEVVGNGVLEGFLLDHKKQNPNSRLVLHGYQNKEFIKNLLDEASVFIYPGYKDHEGREETQGTVVQEAMLMNVPVIVTNVGGVAEAVEDGKTGFVIEPNDINAFVDRILYLYNFREECIAMGLAAHDFACENYSLEKKLELIEELY